MRDVFLVLISGCITLLGVGLTQWFELKKRKSEEDRWFANYFLPKKFDAISLLYAELQTTYSVLSIYHSRKLKDDDAFQELIARQVRNFYHSHHLASIYLSISVNNAISAFEKLTSEAALYIATKVSPITVNHEGVDKNLVVDWPENFDELYLKAKDAVGKTLNPKFLQELEKRFNSN